MTFMQEGLTNDTTWNENTGEPDAWKLARSVRRGAVGKAGKAARWRPTLPRFRQLHWITWRKITLISTFLGSFSLFSSLNPLFYSTVTLDPTIF